MLYQIYNKFGIHIYAEFDSNSPYMVIRSETPYILKYLPVILFQLWKRIGKKLFLIKEIYISYPGAKSIRRLSSIDWGGLKEEYLKTISPITPLYRFARKQKIPFYLFPNSFAQTIQFSQYLEKISKFLPKKVSISDLSKVFWKYVGKREKLKISSISLPNFQDF